MRLRVLYWIATAQIALVMFGGGLSDAVQASFAVPVTRHLGYPDYFCSVLGVAKVLGAIALLAPVPRTVREWAYAGLTFDVCAAILSIVLVGDPPSHVAIPVYALAMLVVSYV